MVPYGGFWWRVLAYMIDAFVLNMILSLWGTLTGVGMMVPGLGMGLGMDPGAMSGTLLALTAGFGFVWNWLYFALMESSKLQGTLGKLAVGLIVTDTGGGRISFLRATGRYFAKMVSSLIFGIGFLMVAFTQRKRGLHDIMAGSLVYKTRDPREAQTPEGIFA
jgi:uncharacterized RDD family membrane protein YckC